jgi:hypothetical protein
MDLHGTYFTKHRFESDTYRGALRSTGYGLTTLPLHLFNIDSHVNVTRATRDRIQMNVVDDVAAGD